MTLYMCVVQGQGQTKIVILLVAERSSYFNQM